MKIAGVQWNVAFAEPKQNRARMGQEYLAARRNDADLVIFPECSTTGYCFTSREEAWPHAEPLDGPTVSELTSLCHQQGGAVLIGLLERLGTALHNTAVWIDGAGVQAVYRKTHLPYLGVDRWLDPGDEPFTMHSLPVGEDVVRVGIAICYDAGFPEVSRALALAGADLIVLPTNWPTGAEAIAEHAIPTRALENHVYFLAVNRVGTERGCRFIGGSHFCDPTGKTLARGSATGEETLLVEIDPRTAREKTIVRVVGEEFLNRIADRRPELYGSLVVRHSLSHPVT